MPIEQKLMWLLQEHWHNINLPEESSERRQEHVRLGVSYAVLGHERRRVITAIPLLIVISLTSLLLLALRSESIRVANWRPVF